MFLLLGGVAIASACSSAMNPSTAPQREFDWRSLPSRSLPSRWEIVDGHLRACGFSHRHKHSHYVGVRCGTHPDQWPPPGYINDGGSSWCVETDKGPVQPGWQPFYTCYMASGESIDLGYFDVVPGGGNYNPNAWKCGPISWSTLHMNKGQYSAMSYVISSVLTGASWNCARTDTVDVTLEDGTNDPRWQEDSGHIDGVGSACDPNGCSIWNIWNILVNLTVFPLATPTPSPQPTGVPTSVGPSYPPTAQPGNPGLAIYDENLKGVVSNGESPEPLSDVGAQMELLGEPTGSGTNISNVSWTAYNYVLGQTFSSVQATESPGPIAAGTNPAVFYYIQGASQAIVKLTASVNAIPMTSYAIYNVESPTVNSMQAVFQDPTNLSSPPWRLELGDILHGPAGIVSTYTAQTSTDYGGYFAESQTINTNPVTNPSGAYGPDTGSQYWADTCWIYNVDATGVNHPPVTASSNSAVTYGPTYDTPAYGLPAMLLSLSTTDSFTDWFLYRPRGNNAIWVTLGKLSWAWGGSVTQITSNDFTENWLLSPSTPENGTPTSQPAYWSNLFIPYGPPPTPVPTPTPVCPTIPTS